MNFIIEVCILVDRMSKVPMQSIQSANAINSKCNNCTLEEMTIIKGLIKKTNITQKELALAIGKSERTIKKPVEKNYDCLYAFIQSKGLDKEFEKWRNDK